MTTRTRRFIPAVLTVSLASASVAQPTAATAAPAALLSAEQVHQAAAPAGRELLEQTLQRADVMPHSKRAVSAWLLRASAWLR